MPFLQKQYNICFHTHYEKIIQSQNSRFKTLEDIFIILYSISFQDHFQAILQKYT